MAKLCAGISGFRLPCLPESPALVVVQVVVVAVPCRRRIPLSDSVHRAGQTVHPSRQRALKPLDRLRQRLQDRVLCLYVRAEGEELVLLKTKCCFAHVELRH
jgi:hypothetical protein